MQHESTNRKWHVVQHTTCSTQAGNIHEARVQHTYYSYNSRTYPALVPRLVQNTPCSTQAAHILNKINHMQDAGARDAAHIAFM